MSDVRKLLHPDFFTPSRKPIGEVEIDWNNPLAAKLRGRLKNFYWFGSGGGRCLITGQRPVEYGTGAASYSDKDGVITTGNTTNYIGLSIDRGSTGSAISGFYGARYISGAVAWSFLENISNWTGIYSDTTGNRLISTVNNSFGGQVTPTGRLILENLSHYAVTKDASTNLHAAKDYSGRTTDTSANFPTVALGREITLGLAKRLARDNPSVTAFKYFAYCEGELTDYELDELSTNLYQILKPKSNYLVVPQQAAGGTTYEVAVALNKIFTQAQVAGISIEAILEFNKKVTQAQSALASAEATTAFNYAQKQTATTQISVQADVSFNHTEKVTDVVSGLSLEGALSLSSIYRVVEQADVEFGGVVDLFSVNSIATSALASTEAAVTESFVQSINNEGTAEIEAVVDLDILQTVNANVGLAFEAVISLAQKQKLSAEETRTVLADVALTTIRSIDTLAGALADADVNLNEIRTVTLVGEQLGLITPDGRTIRITFKKREIALEYKNRTIVLRGSDRTIN